MLPISILVNTVALRKESVDRNVQVDVIGPAIDVVALRKESVDRNPVRVDATCIAGLVALRKESVDRNTAFLAARVSSLASLSARRAWIEILTTVLHWYHISSRSPQGERG